MRNPGSRLEVENKHRVRSKITNQPGYCLNNSFGNKRINHATVCWFVETS